jgi:DNA-binding winged helix-turn-helix (wHTH) protein
MTQSPQYTAYQFGSFTLDLEQGALLGTDGAALPLRPKSFALLRLLVENAGRLLSRDMIMEALWPNIFVTDDNVTQCIHDVRGVLGAEAQLMLRTLPRRGYRFTSDVVAVPSAAASSLRNGAGSGLPPAVVANHREHDENVAEEKAAPLQLPSTPIRHPAAVNRDENRLEARPAERRQLTIMACEVAGLAVLTARLDLEDLREVTTACHWRLKEIIERYHGHVANYSADGVLAYFGYPQADEHDAERAIRAGLALIEAVPKLATAAGVPLHVGIGIATGMVVAGGQAGSSAAQTVTAVGARPISPRVCKHWPMPTRSSSRPRPAAWLATRLN